MEQLLRFKKETPGTWVVEAQTPEDALWGPLKSQYLNKTAFGRDSKTPKVVKVTIEVVEWFEDTPEA
jgi:hypothetical protein